MASQDDAKGASATVRVSVGERVTIDDSGTEYVVLSVDQASGRVELLHLNPARVERDIPVSNLRKK